VVISFHTRLIRRAWALMLCLIFVLDLSSQLSLSNFKLFWVLKVHPECEQPIAKQQGENGENRGQSNDDTNEGVLNQLFGCPTLVIECGFVLNLE
jgi:hypothetical protein